LAREEKLGKLSLCGRPEHLVDDIVLCEDIPLVEPIELASAKHVHSVVALDGPLRRIECSNPEAMVQTAFHKPMILFHHGV